MYTGQTLQVKRMYKTTIACRSIVQETDITSERNVQGTDIKSERNVQGTDGDQTDGHYITLFAE